MRRLIPMVAIVILAAACSDEPLATTTIAPIAVDTTTTAVSTTTTTFPPPTTEEPVTTTTTTAAPSKADTWIAVLASLAVSEYDEAAARQEMTAIQGLLGLTAIEADLLLSDDFATLNPGFWVVHLGGFRDQFQADVACSTVQAAVPDCYIRYLGLISADQPIGHEHGYILAVLESGELGVIDARSGVLVRTVEEVFYGDGRFPSAPWIRPGGTDVFFTVGFEDYWFSCDASDGTLISQSLSGGDGDQIADGFSPIVTPEGDDLLYLAASECLEDPNDANWVITPIDTIVRRDLGTGEEDRQLLELTGDIAEYYEFSQLAWGPGEDLLLMDTEGVLFQLDASGVPRAITDLGEHAPQLIGWYRPMGRVLVLDQIWDDDKATTQISAVDLLSGEVSLEVEFDGLAAAALDATGDHLVMAAEGTLFVDQAEVPIDYSIIDLSW